jgi:membrane-anchored mycosin MYCP
LATAIRQAADSGATVINISAVACKLASEGIGDADRLVGSALQYAVDVKDAVVVAAAGNTGSACSTQNTGGWDSVNTIASPAWYDDYVLTVGSVNADGSPSDFSLAGPWVDVAAPGTDMVSLNARGTGVSQYTWYPDQGTYRTLAGTSYSTPLVTATAALVRAANPQLNARGVMDRIKATATPPVGGRNNYVGYGIVNPQAALAR